RPPVADRPRDRHLQPGRRARLRSDVDADHAYGRSGRDRHRERDEHGPADDRRRRRSADRRGDPRLRADRLHERAEPPRLRLRVHPLLGGRGGRSRRRAPRHAARAPEARRGDGRRRLTVGQDARGGILILGGGFAGAWVARLLGRRGATVVNVENYMLFASLLPEAASGTLEPRHVVVPLRLMCPHADLVVGRAIELDAERQTVRVRTEEELLSIGYSQLVVAFGAIPRALPIPGLSEHALGFKTLADAIHLRNHILRRLEAAAAAPTAAHRRRELTFVFVGAGYAGVEALAELSDLVRDALRSYPMLRGEPQRWVLVDAAPKILPEIPTRLGEYAARQLMRRGVEIRVSTTLESVEAHAATLSGGERIPTSTVVWTAGVRAHPALAQLGLPLDDRGRLVVDE